MFRWYRDANICYAYLVDVPDRAAGTNDEFRASRWFTRGWTLQELIAPSSLEFYAADWSFLGTKSELKTLISQITGISVGSLDADGVSHVCAAERMHWASHRQTAREEDMAYALMGIFDVNMPMLYGEGLNKAFGRLQEEILKKNEDHSLFLFNPHDLSTLEPLAQSPSEFCRQYPCDPCGITDNAQRLWPHDISSLTYETPGKYADLHTGKPPAMGQPIAVTSWGLRVTLWMVDSKETQRSSPRSHWGLLNVCFKGVRERKEKRIWLPLTRSGGSEFFRRTWDPIRMEDHKDYQKGEFTQAYIKQPSYFIPLKMEETFVTIEIPRNSFEVASVVNWTSRNCKLDKEGRLVIELWRNTGQVALVLRLASSSSRQIHFVVFLNFNFRSKMECIVEVVGGKELGSVDLEQAWGPRNGHRLFDLFNSRNPSPDSRDRVVRELQPNVVISAVLKRMSSLSLVPGERSLRYSLYIDLQKYGFSVDHNESRGWDPFDFWAQTVAQFPMPNLQLQHIGH